MDIKRVPNIRFRGFVNDWEQRKLGDLVKNHNAGVYINKENYGEGINIIGVGDIYDNDRFDGEIYRLAPVTDNKFILEENDLIYGESSLVPEGIARTICVTKNGAGSAFAWHTRRVKLDNKIVNSHFATLELNYHPKVRSYLMSVSTQTALTGMTTEGFFGAELSLPTIQEQERISELFIKLDNLISLHHRKLENLKKQKKGLLQKMFPEKGKKVSEIRFPKFTNDWEQRKLGDEAIEIIAGGDIDKNKVLDNGKYPIYANALTNNGIVGFYNDFYRVKAPAVTVTGRGEVGHAKARMIDFTPVVRLLSVRSNHNTYFLENAINNHNVIVESTGVPQLTVPQLANYKICFPKKIEEEIKIGEFFKKLDNLISLHQYKLEKLRKIKESYLEKMFV